MEKFKDLIDEVDVNEIEKQIKESKKEIIKLKSKLIDQTGNFRGFFSNATSEIQNQHFFGFSKEFMFKI